MNGIFLSWQSLLIAGLLLLAAGLAVVLLRLRREQHKPHLNHALEAEQEWLRDEIVALKREVAGLRARLEEDEPVTAPPESESAYGQALKLAQKGLDSAAVAASCGISRGEAELIVALYRASQRP
ncbi:DUF2802 domain-containing protein [Chitinimonas sp. JJ19]|uniref:DUF2802 domain-containing protein n=1 Tax=Chitinimonas sp. JJ19 TaxID=3109352 RepID=UPI001A4A48A6|nr:DUF2802 domain-containing protein [Chitinimonas sp.]